MSAIFIALLAFSSARRVEETEELLRREEAQSHAQQRALPLQCFLAFSRKIKNPTKTNVFSDTGSLPLVLHVLGNKIE